MHIVVDHRPTAELVAVLRQMLAAYNLAQLPELARLPHEEYAALWHDEAGAILGGVIAELYWGWLYVDTVWVADAARGKGIGGALMCAVEHYAAQRNVTAAYLMTSSFQARPFYEKLGYQLIGQNEDRPRHHRTFYLQKHGLVSHALEPQISFYQPPLAHHIRFLSQGLINHSHQHVPLVFAPLCVYVQDEDGIIRGGLYGNTYWDWFDVRCFVVSREWRNMGYGSQILTMTETQLRQQGVLGIVADLADFQAVAFGRKRGFTSFGQIANRPPAHRSYFVQKRLN